MQTALTIGRDPDNDFVIDLPIVSGHHARLTWSGVAGQALLEDLGSSNGTAIGESDRKVAKATISAGDTVYFGNHPIPASELLRRVDPSLAPTLTMPAEEMTVGRDRGCQRVLDRPTVSGRHARLRRAGDRVFIEDLGSSNGTFVNGRRIAGPTEVVPGDLIVLGAEPFRLAPGSSAVTQRVAAVRASSTPPGVAGVIPAPTMMVDARPAFATTVAPSGSVALAWLWPVTLVGLLLQGPILGIFAGLAADGGKEVPPALFALGLASVWLGLSAAVVGLLLDPSGAKGGCRPWASRAAILGGLGLLSSLLAMAVAFPLGGFVGPGLPALGLVMLGTGVGLAVGFVVVLLAPKPAYAWNGMGVALMALAVFGGGPTSLPRSSALVRLISNAAPSRWAFEGLLVSESAARESTGAGDLAEGYFPSETDRMGPRADALALGSMLVGLAGLGWFLVRSSSSGR